MKQIKIILVTISKMQNKHLFVIFYFSIFHNFNLKLNAADKRKIAIFIYMPKCQKINSYNIINIL